MREFITSKWRAKVLIVLSLACVAILLWLIQDALLLHKLGLFQDSWTKYTDELNILPTLWGYKYLALFVITFGASFGLPLPAAPSTIAAAAFASEGYLDIKLVFIANALGSIFGDLSMYLVMRTFGRRALIWVGLKHWLNTPALQNVEQTANAYKAPIIILSRFQVQTTALVNIIAGLVPLNFKRFAKLITLGELLQSVVYTAIGFLFAKSWEALYELIGKFGWLVAIFLTIFMTIASQKIAKRMLK